MLKNKLDFKLVNFALIALIVFFIYQTGSLWIGLASKLIEIVIPFLFAFAFAYACYPFLKILQDKKIPKWMGITIIVTIILIIVSAVVYLVSNIMFNQLSSLFNGIIRLDVIL